MLSAEVLPGSMIHVSCWDLNHCFPGHHEGCKVPGVLAHVGSAMSQSFMFVLSVDKVLALYDPFKGDKMPWGYALLFMAWVAVGTVTDLYCTAVKSSFGLTIGQVCCVRVMGTVFWKINAFG